MPLTVVDWNKNWPCRTCSQRTLYMDVKMPESLKAPLMVPEKLLMGPGPSNCHPRVLRALSLPILGHMHPELFQIMDEIKEGIRYIFQTTNELTLALSASGHGGMEAVMCNLIEPGDRVLIGVNGIWGHRASIMATRYGGQVIQIHSELGKSFPVKQIEEALELHKPKLLFLVQGESSTGILQKLEGIGCLCHRHDCLLAVDTVASLGGVPFFADKWNVDAVYTGSQKALSAPPGITPMSFSPRAQDTILNRKSPPSVYFWDMTILGDQWHCFGRKRVYHHTTCASLLYGLRVALGLIAEEGLENSIARHKQCAWELYKGLNRLGLEPFVPVLKDRLPTVSTIKIPDDCDWKEVIAYAMREHRVEISGGLGPTENKVFRVGLMGYNATLENVRKVLDVLEEGLAHARKLRNSKL